MKKDTIKIDFTPIKTIINDILIQIWVLINPRYWIMNDSYSAEWNKELNLLMKNHVFVLGDYGTKCTAKLGSREIWIANHPYDSFTRFLWVTMPLLQEGLETIKRWGFTYKTCAFNWVKKNKKADSYFWGLGYWTRANSELCLLATKGKPKRISKSVHQICDAKIQEHSKKPDEIRNRIVELCGDLPRIELFARQNVNGWDAWGDEVAET